MNSFNGPHVPRRLRGRRARLEVLQDLSQLGLQSHIESPPRQFSASVHLSSRISSRIAHCCVAARAAMPQRFDSPGRVAHSLRNASTFWEWAFGLLDLTVVATRFSRVGDTFQRSPSSVTRLTVFLL